MRESHNDFFKEQILSDRSLLLHIGAHKTGTSAIQIHMRRNRERLRAHGWDIILPPTPNRKPANWNFMFRLAPGPKFFLASEQFSKLLAEIDSSTNNAIISSEELFFLKENEIRKFSDCMKRKFSNISLVVYLRRQDQMAISHWYQGARTRQSASLFGGTQGPLVDLSAEALSYLDYAKKISHWRRHLSPHREIVREYDRDILRDGDAVSDFLYHTGLEWMGGKRVRSYTNTALSAENAFIIYELREAGVSQPNIQKILKSNILPSSGRYGLPARDLAMQFYSRFDESNVKLAKCLGREALFSDDFSRYPLVEDLPKYSDDSKNKIILRILSSIQSS